MLDKLRDVIRLVPDVKNHLSNKTRFILAEKGQYKTQEFMIGQIRRLVTSLYNNQIGGDFIDIMANIISGQLYDAYTQAWESFGETTTLPDYLQSAYQADVLRQYDFVDQYFRDIIDARIDGKPIDPLLARADLWGNRWTDSYNRAIELITLENGGNLEWVYGETEHCDTCRSLNGIVAGAKEWQAVGVRPQNAPNKLIDCGGWNCQCSLVPTEKRRSKNAKQRIEAIVNAN